MEHLLENRLVKPAIALLALMLWAGCRKLPGTASADLASSALECDRMTYYAVQIAPEERPRYVGQVIRSICGQLFAKRPGRDIADGLGVATDNRGRDLPLKCSLFQLGGVQSTDRDRATEVWLRLRDEVATLRQLRPVLGGDVATLRGRVSDACDQTYARFTRPLPDPETSCVILASTRPQACPPGPIEDAPLEVLSVSLR